MNHFLASLIASCLVIYVAGHGKEPLAPHLSHDTLAALYPTKVPESDIEVLDTVHTCYQGYTLLPDGTCAQEVNEPASRACPTGTLVENGCEVQVPYLYRCPNGYDDAFNGFCNRTVEVTPQFYCPVGYYDDGNSCAQTTPGEIVTQCDIGELIGNNCVSVQRAEHLISSLCPPDSELEEDGNCWKVVDTFDCTDAPAPDRHVVVAPQHHVPIGKKVLVSKGKGAKLRHLSGKLPIARPTHVVIPIPEPVIEQEPCEKEMVAVSAPRPTKVGVASQVCQKKVQVDAQAVVSCPPGFLDNGEYCLLEKVTPATSICLSGLSHDGNCPPVTKRTPKYPGCPKNAYADNGKCFAEESAPASTACPKGFLDNDIACVGIVDAPAWECPYGLTLFNDRCIGQKIRPRITLRLEPELPCTDNKY